MAEMNQDNKFIRSLIQNAQNGKIVSLEELFRMNIGRIYAIILRMTANKSLASLIGVNVLVKVWNGIREFPGDMLFSDWMIRIAIRTTFRELKTGKLVKEHKLQKKIESESGVEEFTGVPIEKVISDLDVETRSLVVMNRIVQLSFSDITDLTGILENDAKDYLTKGIGRISRVFAELEPGEISTMQIEDLPKEIEPDRDIVQFTIDKIREVKEEEFKEEDVQYEEIEKLPKQKIKFQKEKPEKKRQFRINKKYIIYGLSLVLIVMALYYINFGGNNWTIFSKYGLVTINDGPAHNNQKLSKGDLITTGEGSSATIEIQNIGKIKLSPESSIERLEADNTAKLIKGNLQISTESENDYLYLQVPRASVESYYLSNDYSISMDEIGNVITKVTSGWLQVVSENSISILPEGYSIRILEGKGISIPAFHISSSIVPAWLDQYLFEGGKTETLNLILDASKEVDAITLWNLLKRVILGHRGLVYQKLNEYVPHPEGVTKEGALTLNEEMMHIWLEEIEWLM